MSYNASDRRRALLNGYPPTPPRRLAPKPCTGSTDTNNETISQHSSASVVFVSNPESDSLAGQYAVPHYPTPSGEIPQRQYLATDPMSSHEHASLLGLNDHQDLYQSVACPLPPARVHPVSLTTQGVQRSYNSPYSANTWGGNVATQHHGLLLPEDQDQRLSLSPPFSGGYDNHPSMGQLHHGGNNFMYSANSATMPYDGYHPASPDAPQGSDETLRLRSWPSEVPHDNPYMAPSGPTYAEFPDYDTRQTNHSMERQYTNNTTHLSAYWDTLSHGLASPVEGPNYAHSAYPPRISGYERPPEQVPTGDIGHSQHGSHQAFIRPEDIKQEEEDETV